MESKNKIVSVRVELYRTVDGDKFWFRSEKGTDFGFWAGQDEEGEDTFSPDPKAAKVVAQKTAYSVAGRLHTYSPIVITV